MTNSVNICHSCCFQTFSSSGPCCYHQMRQPRNGVRLLAVVLAKGIYHLYRIWRILFLGTWTAFVDFQWETIPHLALLNQSTVYMWNAHSVLCALSWIGFTLMILSLKKWAYSSTKKTENTAWFIRAIPQLLWLFISVKPFSEKNSMHEFEVRDYRVDWNIELSNREVFSVLPRDSIPTSNRKKVNRILVVF